MQGCDNFKEFVLRNCPDNFIITAGLTADTVYGIEFTDKFNRRIYITQSTAGDSTLTISVNDEFGLSKDLFHDFSGTWQLRLFTLDDSNNPFPVQFCDESDYLLLIFQDTTPLPDPNNAIITLDC